MHPLRAVGSMGSMGSIFFEVSISSLRCCLGVGMCCCNRSIPVIGEIVVRSPDTVVVVGAAVAGNSRRFR